MAVIPTGKIGRHGGTPVHPDQQMCGTCGCVVAVEHVAVHVAYHATAGWVQAT